MMTPFLPGVLLLPARDEDLVGVAKRARDEDLLTLREEDDARGWCSSLLGRGWVAAAAATAEENGCLRDEAAAVGAGAEAEEAAMVDPSHVAHLRNRDRVAFDPPPMATLLLPLCAFVTELLKARNDDHVAKRARLL